MDHLRLDDALEAPRLRTRSKRLTSPTLRRRNTARSARQRRDVVPRRGIDSDDGASSDSGLDSGLESDDEDVPLRQGLGPSLARPSATLRVGSGLEGSSRTAIRAVPSATHRISPIIVPSAAHARLTGLGSTLLAAEGDDIDSGLESDAESLADGDESDDETTFLTLPSTSATNADPTASSKSVASTAAAVPLPSTTPPPAPVGVFPQITSTASTVSQSTALSMPVMTVSTPSLGFTATSSLENQTSAPMKSAAATPSVATATLPTPSPPESELASSRTTTGSGIVAVGTPGQTLGFLTSIEHKDMTQGQVAGTVIGVLVGVTIIVIGLFFVMKRLRVARNQASSLRLPFSGKDLDDRPTTAGPSRPSPRNFNPWGAGASIGPRSTVSRSKKGTTKTTSEMLDDLVQASYAAEGGNAGADIDIRDEKSRHRLTDLESQSPPSPGSFLDENFINEKSYAKLEGPWPLRNAPGKRGAGPRTPGARVARWLDGILTPRQSTAAPPPTLRVPAGGWMATKWRPEPPLAGPTAPQVGGVRTPARAAFATGRARDTRMTGTTTTGSSVVW